MPGGAVPQAPPHAVPGKIRAVTPPSASRIVGLDIARGLAIVGMVIAHAIPRPDETELFVDGRSSILFAVLAGMSLGLMSGGATPLRRGQRAGAVSATLIRALVLILIGSALWLTGSEIAIILDYYGVMFALLVPLLFAPRWLLAVLGAALAIGAPLAARQLPAFDTDAVDVASVASAYLFTGYYPAVVWLPFLITGLICARSDLTRRMTQYTMVGLGLAAALLGYGAAMLIPGVDAVAHSGSTAELVGSGGLAVALVGAMVRLAAAAGMTGQVTRLITWPIAAAGAMALSIYTAQALALATAAYVRDTSGAVEYPGWPVLIGLILIIFVSASLWRRYLGRGPLERMLSFITRRRPPPPALPPAPPSAPPSTPEWDSRRAPA